MKLINQSVYILKQPTDIISVYKLVELAARICYKSEDKITEGSYKKIIDMLNAKNHQSPFEHGTIYLTTGDVNCGKKYMANPFSKVKYVNTFYITTNLRVIKENGWEEDLKYLCEPTEYHNKRVSVHIITSIGISRELNRHRCHSICEESTRYCNYSKDKFDNQVTFVIPSWCRSLIEGSEQKYSPFEINGDEVEFMNALKNAQDYYLSLLKMGWTPQQARSVLPLDTKTELIHTAFEDDWKEFFKLRCSSAAHPMMQELAKLIRSKFIFFNYLHEEDYNM